MPKTDQDIVVDKYENSKFDLINQLLMQAAESHNAAAYS
jgi:hypothetical protein